MPGKTKHVTIFFLRAGRTTQEPNTPYRIFMHVFFYEEKVSPNKVIFWNHSKSFKRIFFIFRFWSRSTQSRRCFHILHVVKNTKKTSCSSWKHRLTTCKYQHYFPIAKTLLNPLLRGWKCKKYDTSLPETLFSTCKFWYCLVILSYFQAPLKRVRSVVNMIRLLNN